MRGSIPAPGGEFRLSVKAHTVLTNNIVPMTFKWFKNIEYEEI